MPINHHPAERSARDCGISSTRRARTWQQISDEANADIPNPPADAGAAFDWSDDGTGATRLFIGSSWVVPVIGGPAYIRGSEPDIRIAIRGRQHADGRVERWLAIGDVPEELPAATVRLLAESLAAAHAEIERLRQCATVFASFLEAAR